MEALQSKTTMNLNPQQDGTRIYVAVPKVTKEVREKLSKSAQVKQNETIDKLKKLRSKHIANVNNAHLAKTISIDDDQLRGISEVLRSIEGHFVSLAKEMTQQKQKDLLNK